MTSTNPLSLEDIYHPIDAPLKKIPQGILDILSGPNELAGDVIRYFFSAQGKLLRPALTLLGFKMAQGSSDLQNRAVYLASAFEVFHSATLIHDDIIDSAYLRRNLPTVHIKWNPQIAVLVGDYLHDRAIEAILTHGNSAILEKFLRTAGKVCDGEIHELKEKGNFKLSEDEYVDIVDKKTAVLLACALQAGAVLAGASEAQAEALWNYGRYFGIAFQIIDDCLDFTGQEQEFGKTLGTDCLAGVLTLPLIQLLKVAGDKDRAEFLEVFDPAKQSQDKIAKVLSQIRQYKTIEYSLQKAREYCDKARRELSVFPDGDVKQSLLKLIDYVIERNK